MNCVVFRPNYKLNCSNISFNNKFIYLLLILIFFNFITYFLYNFGSEEMNYCSMIEVLSFALYQIETLHFSTLQRYILLIETLLAEVVEIIFMGEVVPDHCSNIGINFRLTIVTIAILQ